jgi:hypothetical protein
MINIEDAGDLQVRNQIGDKVLKQVRGQVENQIFQKIQQTRGGTNRISHVDQ